MIDSLWLDFAVAIALGLLIGLERERSKGEGPDRRPAGIRTFALASLAGALAIHVGGVALVAAALLKERLGEAGVVAGAAVAGLVDAHSAAISVASLAASGKLTPQDAVLPILAGMTTNAVAKGLMAISAGSWSFFLRIVPGLLLSMSAAWTVAIVSGLQ